MEEEKILDEAVDEMAVVDETMIYIDNPYKIIEKDPEKDYYQVAGNEIITITKGKGVCCLCSNTTIVLYTDNTNNNNVPVQICKLCIDDIMD